MRLVQLGRMEAVIGELKEEHLRFSTASTRVKHDHWKKENEIFKSFVGKVAGSEIEDQAAFLLYHLKNMYPHRSFISVCVDSFSGMKDYSTLSKGARKSRSKIYKAFDELLAKMSGTLDQMTQKKFLNARFTEIHHQDEEYEELIPIPSWRGVLENITSLSAGRRETVFSEKTVEQLNSPTCRIRHKILEKMIRVCAGSDSLTELYKLVDERLSKMTSSGNSYTWKRLGRLLETLQPPDNWRKENKDFNSFVEKFVGSHQPQDKAALYLHQLRQLYPKQSHLSVCINDFVKMKDFSELSKNGRRSRSQIYRAFDELLTKMSGSDDQTTQKLFLNKRFTAMHIHKEDYEELLPTLSWRVVLRNIVTLDESARSTVYSKKTKAQLNNPNCKLRHKILEKLMLICAGSEDLKELEILLDDRLIALYSKKKIHSWSRLDTFVDKLLPLTPFVANKDMEKKNRYKYHTVKKLVDKASGYTTLQVTRQTKSRKEFIEQLFPNINQFTWEMLEDDKYWKKLKEKPSKHRNSIAQTLLKLIEKFINKMTII